MQKLQARLKNLRQQVAQAMVKLDASKLIEERAELQKKIIASDFWQNAAGAQQVVKREAALGAQLGPWQELEAQIADALELSAADDASLQAELEAQLTEFEDRYQSLKHVLQFNQPFDGHDAILRLSAGAGGTDAQDWAQMLERMYLRWAEKQKMRAEIIEESAGEEAGIKSATLSISGVRAYGKLRSEHGVHRLVRLSPFNADSLRQTSFALVEVLPQIDAPDEVQIDDKDLKIDVYRASGHGGQSVNTTDSAVRVTHVPTGIAVAIQNERSQLQNRDTAMKILRSKLAQLQLEQHQETLVGLKGPAKSAEWGNQIRNYVLHPYTLVKDTRTGYETHDAQKVLDGDLGEFINAYLAK